MQCNGIFYKQLLDRIKNRVKDLNPFLISKESWIMEMYITIPQKVHNNFWL